MNAITKNLIIGLLCLLGHQLLGQDIHFTQYYESPTQLNPAYAGHIEGTYRATAIYRSQWSNVVKDGAYTTQGIALDYNIGLKESGNSFGIGVQFMNDQTGANTFNNILASASLAYHLGLDRKKNHFLSIGVQGGILNKRVDVTKVTFADGIGAGTTAEIFDNTSIMNPDLNVGLTWSSYFSKKFKLKIGGAYFHLLEANENLLGDDYPLPSKIAVHAESDIKINAIHIKPHVFYAMQASASELNAGLVAGYDFNYDLHLFLGGGTRLADAGYMIVGLDYKGIHLGFAYDINTSELKTASNGVGAFEISLGYTGTIFKKASPILPAIRFF